MKTWIWPLSWYVRIRELEAENAALRIRNEELRTKLVAAAIQQTSLTMVYTEAVAAIAASVQGQPR